MYKISAFQTINRSRWKQCCVYRMSLLWCPWTWRLYHIESLYLLSHRVTADTLGDTTKGTLRTSTGFNASSLSMPPTLHTVLLTRHFSAIGTVPVHVTALALHLPTYIMQPVLAQDMIWYDMIWYDIYLAAIGLTPGGSSTAHIYTQTVHRIQRTEHI